MRTIEKEKSLMYGENFFGPGSGTKQPPGGLHSEALTGLPEGGYHTGMSTFSLDATLDSGLLILRPMGYLEKSAGQAIAKEFETRFPGGVERCILDLRQVTVINSPGITQLLDFAENLHYERKVPLGILGVTDLYSDIFQSVGLLELAEAFPDEETAKAEL
jgi:anti-anti-sigma regulatory factor